MCPLEGVALTIIIMIPIRPRVSSRRYCTAKLHFINLDFTGLKWKREKTDHTVHVFVFIRQSGFPFPLGSAAI